MKTILIVDDDVYIGDMLEELLTKENYDVGRAYSGTEALMYLSSRRPDTDRVRHTETAHGKSLSGHHEIRNA